MGSEKCKLGSERGDQERGLVLILGLWMLLLLSILGAFAISTSITEIGIAGNYRNAEASIESQVAKIVPK